MRGRAFLLVAALSTTAHAGDVEGAEKLFKAGREAVARGDWPTACQRFRASLALSESEPTIVYVADCDARDGKVADAAASLRDVIDRLARADAKDPLIPEAKKRLAAIEKRIPQLTVRLAGGAPEGTKVTRDGVELKPGALGVALPVNIGEHAIGVKAPGRQDVVRNVTVAEGKTETVEVAPGEPGEEAVVATKPKSPPASGETREVGPADRGGNATLGYVLFGLGVVGLGVAGYEYSAITRRNTAGCTDHVCANAGDAKTANDAASSAKSGRTMLYIGSLVGLAAAGTGAYILLSGGSGSSVGFSVTPSTAAIAGRF